MTDELTLSKDEYNALRKVLIRALIQTKEGKGAERHATPGVEFERQPIVLIGTDLGSAHFELGQAVKKSIESARLPRDRAVAELLGAICYLAAAIVVIESEGKQ